MKYLLCLLVLLGTLSGHAQNLIRNPAFAQAGLAGKPAAWSLSPAGGARIELDSRTVPRGSSAKRPVLRVSSSQGNHWSALSQSDIQVQGDTEYMFSMRHVESEEYTAMMCVLLLELDAKGNKVGDAWYLSTDVPYSFTWTTWSKSFKTKPQTARLALTVYPRGNGSAWFEQVSLVKYQGSAEEKKWRFQPCDQVEFSDSEYWQINGLTKASSPEGVTLTVSNPQGDFGCLKGYMAYDAGHPFLQIKVTAVEPGARWVLVSLSHGMDRISPTQTQAGLFAYDLNTVHPITGKGKIALGIYVLGKGKSIRLAGARTVSKEVAQQNAWEVQPAAITPGAADKVHYAMKGGDKDCGYLLAVKKPFETVAYDTRPADSEVDGKMSIFAAPGEYEPASFIVYAAKTLAGVAVTAGELKGQNSTIPAANIDIRVVKVWYQGGPEANVSSPVFVPELLVKDDGTITSDHRRKTNILHFESIPSDGPDLKPVAVPAWTAKQFWLTVKVPNDAPAGIYASTVTVTPANAPAHRIALELRVLPLQLRETDKIYGMYYSNPPTAQNEETFRKEIADMRAHGLNSGCNYIFRPELSQGKDGQWTLDLSAFKREMDLWIKAGFTKPFVMGFFPYCPDFPGSVWSDKPLPADKAKLIAMIRQIEQCRKANGYPEILYYGVDEPAYDPTGKNLEICRALFNVMHEGGAKTTTAITKEGADKLGNAIDVPIYDNPGADALFYAPPASPPGKTELHYWHPLENPNYDRLRFGLLVWKAKLAGGYPWAYRAEFSEEPYVEFDKPGALRNQMYTYPSREGPIPTIQWEGVREGIDDVRYSTTLDSWVRKAQAVSGNARLAAEAQKGRELLDRLPPAFKGDLAVVYRKLKPDDFLNYRRQIADQIIVLQELLK